MSSSVLGSLTLKLHNLLNTVSSELFPDEMAPSYMVYSRLNKGQKHLVLNPGTCKCYKEKRSLRLWLSQSSWNGEGYPGLSGWAQNANTSFLIREGRGRFDGQKRKIPCDHRGRDWSDEATHKSSNASSQQKLEEARSGFPGASAGIAAPPTPWFQPCETDFGLLAFRTVREYMAIVLSHQVHMVMLINL